MEFENIIPVDMFDYQLLIYSIETVNMHLIQKSLNLSVLRNVIMASLFLGNNQIDAG
jgi:hypothetical protein